MKKALLCLFVAMMGVAHAGTSKNPKNPDPVAPPQDDTLGFSLAAGYDTKYIFRGVDFGDNLVWAGLTVPIKLTDKATFTFAPWYGSIAGEEYDELDLVASLTYDFGFVTAGVGYTWYYFPFSGFETSEPNVTIAKSFAGINWYAGAYLDLEANGGDEGWYFETGANYPIKITEKFSLVPEAKVSWGKDYYGVDGGNNVVVKLSAPYALTKTATIAPYIAGSISFDSLEDAGADDYLIGGVSLTVTF